MRGTLTLKKIELSEQEVRNLRMQHQQLLLNYNEQTLNAETMLKINCGVQAQYVSDAALAINARTKNFKSKDVEEMLIDKRTIIRTWCMRGTLHFLAAEDYKWLMDLHGKLFIQKSHRRYEQLGIDEKLYANCIEKLRLLFLKTDMLTRDEVKSHLLSYGIKLEGQATYHILRRAALEGLICFGPKHDGEETYVLLENWIKTKSQTLCEAEAIDKLIRRYLKAYAPASIFDLSNWSGLPTKKLSKGWERLTSEMIELKSGNQQLYMLEEDFSNYKYKSLDLNVQLLPAYDTYLLGYQNRDIILAPYAKKEVYRGGGLLRPALLINGYIVGTWEKKHYQKRIEVKINTSYEINEIILTKITKEVQKIGNFYGLSAELIL